MAKLPSKVRVGPMDMAVVRVKRIEKEETEDSFLIGMVSHHTSVIKLRKDLSPDQERCTIMHEIIHELLTQADAQDACSEQGVCILSNGITAVLRDNPYLRGD